MRFAFRPLFRRLVQASGLLSLSLALSACGGGGGASETSPVASMGVLSTRAAWVSGGSAYLQVDLPAGLAWAETQLLRNGVEVGGSWQMLDSRRVRGLVSGLPSGSSTLILQRRSDKLEVARLSLSNWPQSGPIFAGAHRSPFYCQTDSFVLPDGSKLGPALDADCNFTPRVHYLYQKTGSSTLTPLAYSEGSFFSLPADVATVTTSTGLKVPMVVRVETAPVNRGIYQSAVLHDPSKEGLPAPASAPAAWNRRLIAINGSGCVGGWYVQGSSIGGGMNADNDFRLLSPTRLAEGYGLFANTLMHPTNNCDAVLASETAVMSKEYFIKRYGLPDFTLSGGNSGGAYTAMLSADRIPGLFDGLLIDSTFPDALSLAVSGLDARLLTNFALRQHPGYFTDAQLLAISGHKTVQALKDLAIGGASRTDPVPGRTDIPGYYSAVFSSVVPSSVRYSPTTRPSGLRASLFDAWAPILGTSPSTGYGLRPYDNVGVQYGLNALKAGSISIEQFLTLNEQIGGYDADTNYQAARSVADAAALEQVQRSGLHLNGSGGLASLPIMAVESGYNEDSAYHYQAFRFAVRERLREANGHADNFVFWRGNPSSGKQGWTQLVQWVGAIQADSSADSAVVKLRRAKPTSDGCWSSSGTSFTSETQTFSKTGDSSCNKLYPSWSLTRTEAGGPVSQRILKCALKPVDMADYPGTWTTDQINRLKTAFPAGVCDWAASKPGATTVPLLSYGPAP